MSPLLWYVLVGTAVGTWSRFSNLQGDYRRYPTSPNGVLIHGTVGFIASGMGAVAVPALLTKNWVAVTFLALAIQQFRDVRKAERNSLMDLEETEFIPRGNAYIDAIAKSFEARNYVAMLIGLATTSACLIVDTPVVFLNAAVGAVAGFAVNKYFQRYTRQQKLGDVAEVKEAKISFNGYNLMVDDIYIMNVGLSATRKRVQEQGYAVMITPKNADGKITLANPGQRRALMSDIARVFGTERYIGTRRDFDTERVAVVVVAIRRDKKLLLDVIKEVPLLESLRRAHA